MDASKSEKLGRNKVESDEYDFLVGLGKELRRRRKMLRMSLKDVGKGVDRHFQQVGKWETAEHRISIWMLYKLAAVLETTPQELLRTVRLPDSWRPGMKDGNESEDTE